MIFLNVGGDVLGVGHERIGSDIVVAHDDDLVFPRPDVSVVHIADGLIHHDAGLGSRPDGESSHCDIGLLGGKGAPFPVVEVTEVIVGDIAGDLVDRVPRLVAEEEVIGRVVLPVGSYHAVVPSGVAEEQQEARHVGLGSGAVVEHLEVAPVGHRVGSAGGELIVYLVRLHDAYPEGVVRHMGRGEPLSLGGERSACGHDDHHVDGAVTVQVLRGDGAHKLRFGEGGGGVDRHVRVRHVGQRKGQRGARENSAHALLRTPCDAQAPHLGVGRSRGDGVGACAAVRGVSDLEKRRGHVEQAGIVEADIVEAGGVAGGRGEAHAVGGAEIVGGVCALHHAGLIALLAEIATVEERDGHRAKLRAVELRGDRGGRRSVGRGEHDGHCGLLTGDDVGRCERVSLRIARGKVVGVEKLLTAGIPAVGIALVERMPGNGGARLVGGGSGRRRLHGGRTVALREEVIGVGGVRIVDMAPAAAHIAPACHTL